MRMLYGPKIRIFKTSDYDLNLEERKAKYNDCDGILCEKCNQEIDKQFYYCTYCYCSPKIRFLKISDYNLNLEERKAKYKDHDCILCEKCNKEIDRKWYYCTYCYDRTKTWMLFGKCKVCFIGSNNDCCSFHEFEQFLENFNKWISENKVIDDYTLKEPKVEISDYDLD